MRWILPLVVAFSSSVEAQQVPGQIDPKGAAPGSGHGAAPQQTTAPSRNQFFSPVMGIQIEGQGVTLPKGVAEEPIIAPPAQPASQPAAEQKPPEQAPPTQK